MACAIQALLARWEMSPGQVREQMYRARLHRLGFV